MDRAAYLAKSWGARLVVLNVLEPEYDLAGPAGTADLPSWRRPPEREAVVAAQMRRDLPGDLQGAEIRVVEGAATPLSCNSITIASFSASESRVPSGA